MEVLKASSGTDLLFFSPRFDLFFSKKRKLGVPELSGSLRPQALQGELALLWV